MTKTLLLVFAFLCLSVCAQDFSFHVFASMWHPSICALESSCYEHGDQEFWNIHGLWPSDGKMGLGYCTGELFDPAQVQDQKADLTRYWNGMYSDDNAFHAHEWARHGTCSGMDIPTYFSNAVQLARNLDIYGTLKKGGIVPGSMYDCHKVLDAIATGYGISNFTVMSKNNYMTQIMLCVDTDLKVQDCASAPSCSGAWNYPSF